MTSSVIRQKGESQNGFFKKTKHVKFSKKQTFLITWYVHVRVRIRGSEMFVFLENLACFVFCWNTRFEIYPFALNNDDLRVYRRIGKKYLLYLEELNFEHIGNSVYTAEFFVLGKFLSIYINYLVFYPSRQDAKWKHFKCTLFQHFYKQRQAEIGKKSSKY